MIMDEGHLAIVTGGAQGIGKAITAALLEAGGKVHFLDINVEEGEKSQKEFDEKYGEGRSKFIVCDVTDKDKLEKCFNDAKSQLGGLNVVCNNAGITCEINDRTHWPKAVDINVTAVIQGTFLGIDLMGKSKGGTGGVIINMASFAGLAPFAIDPVYSATKHAVVGFTRSLAMTSIADKVRISCVCPQYVDTPMVRNALLKPLEVFTSDQIQRFSWKRFEISEMEDGQRQVTLRAGESLLQPSFIGQETLKLIQDKTKNGQALVIIDGQATYYHSFPSPN